MNCTSESALFECLRAAALFFFSLLPVIFEFSVFTMAWLPRNLFIFLSCICKAPPASAVRVKITEHASEVSKSFALPAVTSLTEYSFLGRTSKCKKGSRAIGEVGKKLVRLLKNLDFGAHAHLHTHSSACGFASLQMSVGRVS